MRRAQNLGCCFVLCGVPVGREGALSPPPPPPPPLPQQQHKGGSTESVKDFIAREVKANRVLIFMKGSPKAPQCGFSNMACRVLDAYGEGEAGRRPAAWN